MIGASNKRLHRSTLNPTSQRRRCHRVPWTPTNAVFGLQIARL